MAPPPYTRPYNGDATGQVSIDKTRFMPALDNLLRKHPCLVALPPGTGKTSLKWMVTGRYDYLSNNAETFKKFFGPPPNTSQDEAQAVPFEKKQHICLLFDLREVGEIAGVDRLSSVKSYLRKTIGDFLKKPSIQQVFGTISFTDTQLASLELIVTKMAQEFVSDSFYNDLDSRLTKISGDGHDPVEQSQPFRLCRPLR
jgi:hypothetical protein